MMKYEGICQNISNQSSISKIDKKLVILLTSSYMISGCTLDIMIGPKIDVEIKSQALMEAEIFEG